MSTPQSRIYVCSGVPLDKSYTHTLYFTSLTEQLKYFNGKVSRTLLEYTYLKRNFDIKVDADIQTAQYWNYLYFTNNDGKYYFYFIDSVEYKSDTTVILHLEMDVIQTYMLNWDLMRCFIERMTPASDEVGSNTVDEGLELGELKDFDTIHNHLDYTNYCLMALSSIDLTIYVIGDDGKPIFRDSKSGFVNGIYNGLGLYAARIDEETISSVRQTIEYLNVAGKTDGVVAMWLYPQVSIDVYETNPDNKGGGDNTPFHLVKQCNSIDYSFLKDGYTSGAIENYTPKNNKLFTYPYRYLHIYNNMGNGADLRFERFDTKSAEYAIESSPLPDGGLRLVPKNYNGQSLNYEHSLTLTGFPSCAWNSDTYKIWLAQNQNQLNHQATTGAISTIAGVGMMVAGAVTANPVMMGSGAVSAYAGASQIGAQLAQQKDMQTLPDQARGSQNASLNAVNNTLTFKLTVRGISRERARIIDDYFTMYGYKQLCVDKPSIHNRELFTYIKTRGCTVGGEICNDDKVKIASIFDNGVTFWTRPADVGRYDLDNGFL